jgi:hypothetical protein
MALFSEETLNARIAWMDIFQALNKVIANQDYHIQQSCPLTCKEK